MGLAFGLAWLMWLPPLAVSLGFVDAAPWWCAAAGLAMPGVAALALEAGEDFDVRRIGAWLRRQLDPRAGFVWYFLAMGLPLLAALLCVAVGLAVGAPIPTSEELARLDAVFPADVPRPVQLMVFVPLVAVLGELGWRGWLLPRLQNRMRAFEAAGVLALVTVAWRLPSAWFDPLWFAPLPALVILLAAVPQSIVATWLYNGSQGSVLVCAVFATTSALVLATPFAATPGGVLYVAAMSVVALAVTRAHGVDDLAPTPRVELA